MFKRLSAFVLCSLLFLSFASAKGATLHADTSQVLKPMSQMLYGLFYEDINYAADGGLYAELLQNRSFEYRSFPDAKAYDAFTGWVFNEGMKAKGSATLLTEQPLNANNPRYMRVEVEAGLYRVVNTGYPERLGQAGIPLKEGLVYKGAVHLRNAGFEGTVSVQLQNRAGEALSDEVQLDLTDEWQKQGFELTATMSEPGLLVFTLDGLGALEMDMASLFPGDSYGAHWQNGGLRADLVEALRELKPRFIRFPGGCVAEGSYTTHNIYRWKDTIGPIEQRKENENTWGYMQSYGLGFHEYFQLCEDLGAQPLPVVSAAMVCQVRSSRGLPLMGNELEEYIQDVLDLIEYATGPVDSPWGSQRAQNGHPEPFELNYLAIGNENWGSEYFYRYGLIKKAVMERYPNLTLVVAAGPVAEGDLIRDSWNTIRKLYPNDLVDEHYYMPTDWFFENTTRYDHYPRQGNQVFLGEYAAHEPVQSGRRPNNLYSALAEAAYLTGIERNSDLVTLACYAPLLAREGRQQWTPNLLWFNSDSVLKTPNYYVQQMFAGTLGRWVLNSTLDTQGLYQVVTMDEENVYVKLVNPGEQPVSLQLNLMGLNDNPGELTTLAGQKHQTNTFASPDNLVPVKAQIKLQDGSAELLLKPWSLSIISIQK